MFCEYPLLDRIKKFFKKVYNLCDENLRRTCISFSKILLLLFFEGGGYD